MADHAALPEIPGGTVPVTRLWANTQSILLVHAGFYIKMWVFNSRICAPVKQTIALLLSQFLIAMITSLIPCRDIRPAQSAGIFPPISGAVGTCPDF